MSMDPHSSEGAYIGAITGDYGKPDRTPEEIIAALDSVLEQDAKADYGVRLRPSSLGKDCLRSLMFDFWWLTEPVAPKAKQMRIFNDGHRIEDEIVADLKRIGFEVITRDPTNPKKQISVKALGGHMFGYLDSVLRDREGSNRWMVGEMKSHNKASFDKLKKSGVEASKPEHAAQLTIYLYLTGTERGLYAARCKDSGEPYYEHIDLNVKYAERLLERGKTVLARGVVPPKVGASPESYKCKFCSHHGVCHNGERPARNCRTCEHITLLDEGKFGCKKHGCEVEKDLAIKGCDDYDRATVFYF